MKSTKKEIRLLFTFIIIFIICAFLLLLNILLMLPKLGTQQKKYQDFDKVSKSVVSIENYNDNSLQKKGSGFIYKVDNKKVYILTNNHVVEDASTIRVYIEEDKHVEGTLLGYDKYLDVAVVSIENDKYKALKLNNKENLNVGDQVYTIGTPLDNEFFNTITSGIISKTSKLRIEENAGKKVLMNMIQTDVITNPGNSGGPLLNENLEVIGICTSVINTEKISGISYAVPIKSVINKLDLLEKEEVKIPKIGNAKIVDISDSKELYSNDLIIRKPVNTGVVVLDNDKESSLKKGDIIIKIDNNEVKNIYYYEYYLSEHLKDEKVKLTILRNNKEKDIKVKLS